MSDKMEPQTLRGYLECLWVAYRPTRRKLHQLEQADKRDLASAPLHRVLQAVHEPWFYQTQKCFARAELLRRVGRGVFFLVSRYSSSVFRRCLFRPRANK